MTVFSGGDAIREFLGEFEDWLSDSVDVYLLEGSAMTVRGLKDQTEDIDLALGVPAEFEHVHRALRTRGFEVEHHVLGAVDDGVRDVAAIRERVRSNVRELSADQGGEVDAAIDRLVEKRVLDEDTVRR